jgi:hypothetical protein
MDLDTQLEAPCTPDRQHDTIVLYDADNLKAGPMDDFTPYVK